MRSFGEPWSGSLIPGTVQLMHFLEGSPSRGGTALWSTGNLYLLPYYINEVIRKVNDLATNYSE